MQCCAAVGATCRKQQPCQLWVEGLVGERGVDCFVLWSYPIWVLMSELFCCQLYIPMALHSLILYFLVIIDNADMYLMLLINILWFQVERFTESQIDGIDFIVFYPYSNSPLLLLTNFKRYVMYPYRVFLFVAEPPVIDHSTPNFIKCLSEDLQLDCKTSHLSKLSKLDWVMEYC